jgi:hypothetical protein
MEEAKVIYPYSDEYMIFEEDSKRYVLTSKYVFEVLGVDLEGALSERKAVNVQVMVKHFLTEVSDDIYDFIHAHGFNTEKQDYLISKCPSLRKIIQKAMGQQFIYSRLNGLLGYSVEAEKQQAKICPKARETLLQTAPELGFSILYTGVY